MSNPLVRKLELLGPLSQEARRTLEGFSLNARLVGADQGLVRAGERPSDCKLVVSGFTCRCKPPGGGRRQIVSCHVPGDISDLTGPLLGQVDRGIYTTTQAEIVFILHATLLSRAKRQRC